MLLPNERRCSKGCGLAIGVLAAVLLVASPSAGTELAANVDADDSGDAWTFELIPYFWIPANTTNVTIGDESTKTCTSIRDGLSLFADGDAGGGMMHVRAEKGDLSFWADLVFNSLNKVVEGRLVDLRIKNLSYFLEYGARYRLLRYPTTFVSRAPITLSVLAGARWTRMTNEIDLIELRSFKSITEFMDPLVGGSSYVPLYDFGASGVLAATFRGDIGGFGVGSDLSWNLLGGLRWTTPWAAFSTDVIAYAGYKAYYTRFSSTDDGITTTAAMQYNGPLIGVGFQF